jgi:hypothetical protein
MEMPGMPMAMPETRASCVCPRAARTIRDNPCVIRRGSVK